MVVEVGLERTKATHDVLRRISPIDTQDEELRPTLLQLGLEPPHLVAPRELLELEGIDRDRPRSDKGAAPCIRADALVEVAVRLEQVAARAQEVAAPAMRVEAEHVVGEQAFVDRSPNRLGQHAPEIGLGPRNVDEVDKRSVRLCVSDEPRREAEVIVMEEDG